MVKKWYILWTSTLRNKNLIDYIVYKFNGRVWMPSFKLKDDLDNCKQLPLYPSYYFINATPTEINNIQDYIKQYNYSGLIFLKSGNSLACLTEDELNQIKDIEENYTIDKYLHIDPNIKLGSNVRIKEGPFVNTKGTIAEIRNRDILLMLENFTKLWCSLDNLELVK